MSLSQLSAAFFLQMALILVACRLVGLLARRLGQPQVVGEMIAGVCLGPSLLGWLFPQAQAWLFPKETLRTLYVGAQAGVGLYMFLVGLEFRIDLLRKRARSAVAVSVAGMLVPFLLAVLIAPHLLGVPGLFSPEAKGWQASLFLGAAIAITAFPMLARIIHERGLSGTALGTLALAAGAVDDAAAWCVLAVVIASFGGGAALAWKALCGGALYAVIALWVVRPWMKRATRGVEQGGTLSDAHLGWVLALLMLGSWVSDAIGIHTVFGGFLLGVAMPKGRFSEQLRARMEPMAVVFFLPMFFTYSGLNTRLDVLGTLPMLGITLLLLTVSILGKGVACWVAARLTGQDQATSLAVGSLMNARGLMELIILNIGLQHGVIQSGLFSIMVTMAIVTTLMASPLFEAVYGRRARTEGRLPGVSQ